MKHLFIINPAAGSRDRTEAYKKKIREAFQGSEEEYRVEVSKAPGDCCRLAREAAESGEEYRIYACGGDGTLNEVAAGAAGFSNAAVTVFAGGSGNDFVKMYSDRDAFRDLERMLDCQEVTFDQMKVNGDISLNIASVGLDARIGTDVSNYKRIPLLQGFRAYAASTVINVIRGISEHYVIKINGQTIDGQQTMICACNGRYYGGGFNPVPTADPTDGILDVLVVRKVSRLQVPGVVGKYKAGRYKELPHLVTHYRTDKVEILCDKPTPINLDGELRTWQDVTITVAEEKLRFFYPKGLTWAVKEMATT